MTVFALDASGQAAGICVMQDGTVLFARTLNDGLTHSETLLSLADTAFAACGLTPAGVDRFAVSIGPGSFTGLRIGLSLIKGLALPRDIPAVGVSTLRAAALACTHPGVVIPALNARRGEVYWAAFDRRDGCRRLVADTVCPAAEVRLAQATDGGGVFFVGSGAEMCYNTYAHGPKRADIDPLPPIAQGVALAAHTAPAGPASALQPRYLRLSQAERQRAGQQRVAP